jgi:hypothetical protein
MKSDNYHTKESIVTVLTRPLLDQIQLFDGQKDSMIPGLPTNRLDMQW